MRGERDDHWQTLAKLIGHPLRAHVLFKYSEADTSPSAVAADLGERLNVVSYHTNVLRRGGLIELVRTERRRGAVEHFYRATLSNVIEDAEWAGLPTALRRVLARRIIDGAQRDAADALPRGGMDGPTAHMSRSYFVLDDRGRSELASLLAATFARARDIDRASRERGGDHGRPFELIVMSFERDSSP